MKALMLDTSLETSFDEYAIRSNVSWTLIVKPEDDLSSSVEQEL
jgi:hypothetical protein